MDELVGLGWRLFVDGRKASEPIALDGNGIQTIVLGGSGLHEKEAVAAAWFDANRCRAAIVRPDHYVYCGITDLHKARGLWSELQDAVRAEPAAP